MCQTFEYIVQYIYIVQVPAHSSGYGNVYVQAGAGPQQGAKDMIDHLQNVWCKKNIQYTIIHNFHEIQLD